MNENTDEMQLRPTVLQTLACIKKNYLFLVSTEIFIPSSLEFHWSPPDTTCTHFKLSNFKSKFTVNIHHGALVCITQRGNAFQIRSTSGTCLTTSSNDGSYHQSRIKSYVHQFAGLDLVVIVLCFKSPLGVLTGLLCLVPKIAVTEWRLT